MLSSLENFHRYLPEKIQELLENLRRDGFEVVLVGGCIRDLLKYETPSKDLDFEIRSPNESRWEERLKELGEKLAKDKDFTIELLAYSIIRLNYRDWTCEFGSPRIEHFEENSFGHKNFTVSLVPNLSFKEAFKRRDFTMNAIGVSFGELTEREPFRMVDPFLGAIDLKAKILRPCGGDFYRDPVRFVRAIRFRLKYGMKFHHTLVEQIRQMNLSELSTFYFFDEFFKFGEIKYFSDFFSLAERYRLPLSETIRSLNFLANLEKKEMVIPSKEYLLKEVIFEKKATSDQLELLARELGLKKKLIVLLEKFREGLSLFEEKNIEGLKKKILITPEDQLKKLPEINTLQSMQELVTVLDEITATQFLGRNILKTVDQINQEVQIKGLPEALKVWAKLTS